MPTLPSPVLDLNGSLSGSYTSGSTWYDLTANNYDFTMYNPNFTAPTGSTPGFFTFPLRAQTSTPITVYGEYIGTPAVTGSAFSCVIWVRRDVNADSYNQYFESAFHNGGGNSPYNGWNFCSKGVGQGGGNYGTPQLESQTINTWSSSSDITDGVWTMISFAVSGTNLTFYIDGTAQGGTSSFSTATPTTGMYICKSDNRYSWMGDIAIIRLYNSQLNSTNMTDIYNDDLANYINPTPPPSYQGLVGGRTFGQGFAG